MIKLVVTAVIAVLVGAIAVQSFYKETDNYTLSLPSQNSDVSRIEALEIRLDQETEQRLQLQQQLDDERQQRLMLEEQLDQLAYAISQNPEPLSLDQPVPELNRSSFGLPSEQDQIITLVNAGFDEEVAARIVELETDMYQAIVRARFGGTAINPRDLVIQTQKTLRQELGDDQYELYLESTGRPTAVPVAAIAENSAGQIAGLEIGDQIVSYDGERVFNLLDLQESTQTGTLGQTVIIEVLRGEQALSYAIPRGQIGISTGRTGFGFGPGRN